MRVMVDTNVFVSALLCGGSSCHRVLSEAADNHELVLCDYIIDECYEVANRKFPTRINLLDGVFAKLRYELVTTPRAGAVKIADVKDQPILNAAMQYGIDVLVSGDRHFLSLQIDTPEILSPAEFLNKYAEAWKVKS